MWKQSYFTTGQKHTASFILACMKDQVSFLGSQKLNEQWMGSHLSVKHSSFITLTLSLLMSRIYMKTEILTHCGPVTQICVFCVFALQLWKTDDANLPFNTRLVFTHLITQ
jgi:hypothetical protein